MKNEFHVGVIIPICDMSEMTNEYYMRVSNFKEGFIKRCVEEHLPKAIFNHVNKYGLKSNHFVINYMAKHCLIKEHPDGLTEFVFDGKVVGTLRVK